VWSSWWRFLVRISTRYRILIWSNLFNINTTFAQNIRIICRVIHFTLILLQKVTFYALPPLLHITKFNQTVRVIYPARPQVESTKHLVDIAVSHQIDSK
jgi:hypothetical protein